MSFVGYRTRTPDSIAAKLAGRTQALADAATE